jgi:hypothetical protein
MPCGQQFFLVTIWQLYTEISNTSSGTLKVLNREAIDVFFAARVTRQKGLRLSASVCG